MAIKSTVTGGKVTKKKEEEIKMPNLSMGLGLEEDMPTKTSEVEEVKSKKVEAKKTKTKKEVAGKNNPVVEKILENISKGKVSIIKSKEGKGFTFVAFSKDAISKNSFLCGDWAGSEKEAKENDHVNSLSLKEMNENSEEDKWIFVK